MLSSPSIPQTIMAFLSAMLQCVSDTAQALWRQVLVDGMNGAAHSPRSTPCSVLTVDNQEDLVTLCHLVRPPFTTFTLSVAA